MVLVITLIFCSYKYYCRNKNRNSAEFQNELPMLIRRAEIGTQTVLATASIRTRTEIQPSIQRSHAGIQVDLKQDVAIEFNEAQAPVSDKGKNTFSTGLVTN